MGYGSGGVTKREYGCYLAASLAYLMHRQRDAVGLIAFDDRIVQRAAAGRAPRHLRTVLLALERLPRGASDRRRQAARRSRQGARQARPGRGHLGSARRAGAGDRRAAALPAARHRRHRLPRARPRRSCTSRSTTRPASATSRSASEVFAEPAAVRERLPAARSSGFVDTYRRELGGAGIDYHLLDTSKPLDLALMAYLNARGRGLMFGLGFLAPAFLAGLLAVAVPIALHLFRRRTDRVVDFPAVQMLPQAPVERQERRRLRDLLLLALRVAALVLLALSFARPYFVAGGDGRCRRRRPSSPSIARSALGRPGTWAEARRLALRRRSTTRRPRTWWASCVRRSRRSSWSRRRPIAPRRAPRSRRCSPAPAAPATPPAFARAAEALGRGRRPYRRRDRPAAAAAGRPRNRRRRPTASRSTVRAVPPPAGNLAVTSVRRTTARSPRWCRATRRVRASPRARLRVGGARGGAGPRRAGAAGVGRRAAHRHLAGDRRGRSRRSTTAKATRRDNRRFLLLDRRAPASMLVLTADPPESATTGLYVQRALEAAPSGSAAEVTVVDGRRLDLSATPSRRDRRHRHPHADARRRGPAWPRTCASGGRVLAVARARRRRADAVRGARHGAAAGAGSGRGVGR